MSSLSDKDLVSEGKDQHNELVRSMQSSVEAYLTATATRSLRGRPLSSTNSLQSPLAKKANIATQF